MRMYLDYPGAIESGCVAHLLELRLHAGDHPWHEQDVLASRCASVRGSCRRSYDLGAHGDDFVSSCRTFCEGPLGIDWVFRPTYTVRMTQWPPHLEFPVELHGFQPTRRSQERPSQTRQEFEMLIIAFCRCPADGLLATTSKSKLTRRAPDESTLDR